MNKREARMLDLLRLGRDQFGFAGVKAEFEAEGTRFDEYLRVLELARKAGLRLALKIGGCEAVTDLLTARQIGVDYVIAPMVETAYAASKFIEAKNKVFPPDERDGMSFLINLETITGYEGREALCAAATVPDGLQGIVFGRVDFVLSAGMGRGAVNADEVSGRVEDVARICRERGLELVVGGGVSTDSVEALRKVAEIHLTRFETRKVVFDAGAALSADIDKGLAVAVEFELLWLQNKRDYYRSIAVEDDARLSMLESRFKAM